MTAAPAGCPASEDASAAPERSLRVLAVGNVRSLNLLRWAGHLVERGHEVHVVSDRPPIEPELPLGVASHRLQALELSTRVPLVRRPMIPGAIRRLAERLRVDAVHAHYLLPYGHWAARGGFRPLVVSPWGTDALVHAREPGRGRRWASAALAAADLVVVNSRALEEACIQLGADPSRIRRFLWHVDLDGFAAAAAGSDLRSRLGWPEDALVVLSLRNFRPDVNIDILVRAFAAVVLEEPRARLLLAARSDLLRAQVETLVAELQLRTRVAFVRVTPKELPALVGSGDIVVSLANSDSAPPSLLEAMTAGRPLVCAQAASIDEWVGPGDGAEIVQRRDVEGTAAAILGLLRDPDLRGRYGERNARVVRERVQDPAPALERLYRELVAR